MKGIFTIFILALIFSCSQQPKTHVKVPTEAEFQEKRDKLTFSQLDDIQYSLSFLDDIDLDEIKSNYKKSIKHFDEDYVKYKASLEEEFNELNKNYKPEEEEFSTDSNLFEFEPQQDSAYVESLKKGIFFEQDFKRDTTYINTMGRNSYLSGRAIKRYGKESPSMSFESLSNVYVKKIYYHDGTVNENYTSKYNDVPYISGSCSLDTGTKRIDSIETVFKVYYITQFDSVFITKANAGKTKNDIKINSLHNNQIVFDASEIELLEVFAYNEEGKQLEKKTSTNYIRSKRTEKEEKAFHKEYYQKIFSAIENVENKEDALKIIENNLLDKQLNSEAYSQQYYFFKGNIDKVKILKETRRDTLQAKVTFVNIHPVKDWYINPFDDNTKFVDANGETIFTVPIGDLEYINHQKEHITNRYFFKAYNGETRDDEYYHLDIKNKKLNKLEDINHIHVLNEELVQINYGYEGKGYVVNQNNEKVTNEKYSTIKRTGDLILITNYIGKFSLLDSKGKPTELKDIDYVSEFYHGIAKVKKDKKFSFINTKGELLHPFEFDIKDTYYVRHVIEPFTKLQIVKKGDFYNGEEELYGVVDFKNQAKITIPVIYKELYTISDIDPVYVVNKNSTPSGYGIIDAQGKIIKSQKYSLDQIRAIIETMEF